MPSGCTACGAAPLRIDVVRPSVVAVVNIMIGLITPPYGLLLFVVARLSGAPVGQVTRALLPFIAAMVACLALIAFAPALVLWLPRRFGYAG